MNTNLETLRRQFSLQPSVRDLSEVGIVASPMSRLVLGEKQDIVRLDAKDRIVGYDKIGAGSVDHYDQVGELVSRSLAGDNGSRILLDPDRNVLAQSYRQNAGVQAYFNAGGDYVGEARLQNETFVEYFDRSGVKIGVAIIAPNRVTLMNSRGHYMGRKNVQAAGNRWLAISDAWDMFDALWMQY